TDLTILRQITEQDEIANVSLKGLFVKLRLEHPHVHFCSCRSIRHENVQVFEAEILQRQRRRCRRLSSCQRMPQRNACERPNSGKKSSTSAHSSPIVPELSPIFSTRTPAL